MPRTDLNLPDAPARARVLVLPAPTSAVLRDYWTLIKPEIAFLVALSSLAGFVLGAPEGFDGWTLLFLLVGVTLTAGGGGVLNHYLERDLDAQMRRTMDRPLPAGRLRPEAALRFGVLLVMGGVGLLCPLTNPLTGVLAALTVALYIWVYTPLKRRTVHNTVVGTLPGALPALGGWTAATGSIGWGGVAIFAILAVWQMPHFLSLAWMYKKDYARAGYRMLPVEDPEGTATARQTLGYTLVLLAVSATPFLAGVSSAWYLAGALGLGVWFVVPAWRFYQTRTAQDARRVLLRSIVYIPALVGFILLDRIF